MHPFLSAVRGLMAWLAIAFLSTGCSRYLVVPNAGAPPEQWSEVRAHLTVPADYPAGEVIVRNVSTLFGGLLERNDDEVVVSLSWVRSVGGATHPATGEAISIPLHNLRTLEVKRIAPLPTAVLVGLIALSVIMVPVVFGGAGSESSGGNGDDGIPTFPAIRSR